MRVPFFENYVVGTEEARVLEAIRSGRVDGDGPFTRRVEAQLAAQTGAHRVLLTDSVDSALEIALALAGVKGGDQVAMPAFNYMSAANACLARGAQPVFIDCCPDRLDLDLDHLERIGPGVRAIVTASYAGRCPGLDRVLELAQSRGLAVVEDASLGFGATDRGRALGTAGSFGAWCFHAKRHVHGGEAGALVIQDPTRVDMAEELRERGTTRQRLLRGETADYAWVRAGRAALASDLAAAFLSAQLDAARATVDRLRGHCQRYRQGLADLERRGRLRLPPVAEDDPASTHPTQDNGGIFYLLLPDGPSRNALARHLAEAGVVAAGHYDPLHLEPMGQRLGYGPKELPNVVEVSARLLRLPVFVDLTSSAQDHVLQATRGFFQDR